MEKKTKTIIGCLVIVFIIVVLGIGSCVYMIYSEVMDIPEYAKKEVIYSEYKDLISDVDDTVSSSKDLLALASLLRKKDYPENILYLKIEEENNKSGQDNQTVEILKIFNWTSHGFSIVNGAGYGSLTNSAGVKKKIIIIDRVVSNQKGKTINYVIYIERK